MRPGSRVPLVVESAKDSRFDRPAPPPSGPAGNNPRVQYAHYPGLPRTPGALPEERMAFGLCSTSQYAENKPRRKATWGPLRLARGGLGTLTEPRGSDPSSPAKPNNFNRLRNLRLGSSAHYKGLYKTSCRTLKKFPILIPWYFI